MNQFARRGPAGNAGTAFSTRWVRSGAPEPLKIMRRPGVRVSDVRFTRSAFRANVGYERTLANYISRDPLVLMFVKVLAKEIMRMSEPDHGPPDEKALVRRC